MTKADAAAAPGTPLPATAWFPFPATFWQALWGYPAYHALATLVLGLHAQRQRALSGPNTTRQVWRDAAQGALKLVSTSHALLATYRAASDVMDPAWTTRNLITARVHESNAVVGLEAGYLIQDTLLSALLDSAWSPVMLFTPNDGSPGRIRFDRVLRIHHVVLGSLLTLFLEFARRGRDKGVFFVEAFVLMNASTPSLNLRWWLARQAKAAGRDRNQRWADALASLSVLNEATLIATFAICRIGLIFYMLHLYGRRTGRSLIGSYLSIPMQCKSGTAALLILNLAWWTSLVQRSLARAKQVRVGNKM